MTDFEEFVGRVYKDRDTRSYNRQVRIERVGNDSLGRPVFTVKTVLHQTNPKAVGHVSQINVTTLKNRYKRIS